MPLTESSTSNPESEWILSGAADSAEASVKSWGLLTLSGHKGVMLSCKPSCKQAEAGGLLVQDQAGLPSESLSSKTRTTKEHFAPLLAGVFSFLQVVNTCLFGWSNKLTLGLEMGVKRDSFPSKGINLVWWLPSVIPAGGLS